MVDREVAIWMACGAGSVRECRVACGFRRIDCACRGPIRPEPTIAMEIGCSATAEVIV